VTLRLIVDPLAEAEMLPARDWYDQQSPGRGADFLRAVEAALAAIKGNPLQYQIVWKHYRRVGLGPKYPYGLYYNASEDVVRVIACVHGRPISQHTGAIT
jgi:plasmid stabilization system protein ParE